MPTYIHDNTEDEKSHVAFLNAYLESRGGEPVDLSHFLTLPSSEATGARQVKRLTNLMELKVDTSYWTPESHSNATQRVTAHRDR
jgi:hypothetical protein